MRMKKITVYIMSVMLSLNMLSCGKLRDNMVSARLDKLNTSNDNQIADENLSKIIDALENRNTDEIKSIFSANVLEEELNIDNGINYLMNFYKGKMESKDEGIIQTGELSDNGEKKTRLKCKYIVNTGEETYLVFFIYHKIDSEDPNNVGISMLQIIKESDIDNEFDWGGSKTRCAGIYIPDSEKKQVAE